MTTRGWMACLMLAVGLAALPIANASSHAQRPAETTVIVQVGLRALGYDPGTIDGLGGPRTRAALRAYAQDRGVALNQATLPLVLTLLQDEAYRPRLSVGDHVEPECPAPEEEVSALPIEEW